MSDQMTALKPVWRSSAPILGPTVSTRRSSTDCSPTPFCTAATIALAVLSGSATLFTLIKNSFSSPKRVISAFSKPDDDTMPRISCSGTGCSVRISTKAPPAKSMDCFKPRCTAMETIPANKTVPETISALRATPTKLTLGVLKNSMTLLDAQLLDVTTRRDQVVDHTRAQERGEHADDDAENKGGGEAAYRPRTVLPQDERRDEGGDVRVQDGAEGAVVTGLDGGAHRLAAAQFFANTLEDEHVGVHRHTDGEN